LFYFLTPFIIKFMKNKKRIFFLLLFAGLFVYLIFYKIGQVSFSGDINNIENTNIPREKVETDKVIKIDIIDGSTYGSLMATSGISYATSTAIYEAAKPVYDLIKIRSGRTIDLIYDKDTSFLKELVYKIDSEEELHVINTKSNITDSIGTSSEATDSWTAEIKLIPYTVKTKTAAGTIKSSMYQAALDNDIDIRAIIELANAFQWTIDFAMDPRVGDTFKFIFEERFLDAEYVMPGRVLAGVYINDGTAYEVFYFEEDEENTGFFDNEGNSVQKIFLRAPVSYKYISSGYTTGARYIAAFRMFTSSHMAIDYAAAIGTPVRAVGDGTIAFRRYSRTGYGNFISIRHNGTYTTNYAHLSKIYVRGGQKVKQSDIIGTVGSTGFSTGPHLHYEMIKNGVKVNPLREILPPGKPIKEENKERFFSEIEKWQKELNE